MGPINGKTFQPKNNRNNNDKKLNGMKTFPIHLKRKNISENTQSQKIDAKYVFWFFENLSAKFSDNPK